MGPFGMIMFQPGASDGIEVFDAEEDEMIQAFAAKRADEAFDERLRVRRLRLETQLHEVAGAILLMGLAALGSVLRWLDRRWVIETWLNQRAELSADAPRPVWDVVVPGPVLAVCGFLVIIGCSIVGCYAYYPSPDETLEELNLAKTEALGAALSAEYAHALHWIPICEGWNRRLQVGAYLRRGQLSDYHRMKARVFRDKLELLEHMVEDHDPPDEIRQHIAATSLAFSRLSAAYRNELH